MENCENAGGVFFSRKSLKDDGNNFTASEVLSLWAFNFTFI